MPIQLSVLRTGSANTPPASEHVGHGYLASPGSPTFASALTKAIARQSGHGDHDVAKPATVGTQPTAAMRDGTDSGASHPGHIPFAGAHGKGHLFQQKVLGLRVYRQQVIASNIANADTPGYRALDVDMAEALSAVGTPPLPMTQSSYRHLGGGATPADVSPRLIYHQPSQFSVDGNTVEMDIERQKFAENALMFQFSLDRVGTHYKHLAELLQSLK